MNFLDLLTLLSYVALNIDMVLQIGRVYRTKSSEDLSLPGMTIRYVAIIIILVKFMSLSSWPLVVGQGLIAVTFTAYFVLVVMYFLRKKRS